MSKCCCPALILVILTPCGSCTCANILLLLKPGCDLNPAAAVSPGAAGDPPPNFPHTSTVPAAVSAAENVPPAAAATAPPAAARACEIGAAAGWGLLVQDDSLPRAPL
eukprot:GHUV01025333.1.p3 GENE.GHUV01025333.1~~GHUV01025333.1.p3  ORF type:complete len:108 (-),score=42.97 GHUV01025333.1:381-704(-)